MYLLHHYVQKGWKVEDFLRLPELEKLFYQASMEYHYEEIEKATKSASKH